MKRLAMGLLGLWAALLLGACAGEKVNERPPLAQRVFDMGNAGQAAYSKGDLARARRWFEQALREAWQIEDSTSVAVLSINLARVEREAGEANPGKSLARLEAISPWHRRQIPARLDQEIELLTALLLADLGQTDQALRRLAALRENISLEGDLAIGTDSLQARLVLEKGEARIALDLATSALTRFHAHPNRLELANLLRVQGDAHLALGDFTAARPALEGALAIDKALAHPAKIALDLEALASAAQAAQDAEAHARYQERLDELKRARLSPVPH